MDISIVINCSDDWHVFKTIESIDADVEVICSITPNEQIEARLTDMGIRFAITAKGSQSKTTNAGIGLVTHDKFILMDSDCYFQKGFIETMDRLLDHYFVVNGNIIYDDNNSLLSKAIAKCRKFDDTFEEFAHKPGLALKKGLLTCIGGYWFDERVSWAEDSELSYRIRRAGVKICQATEASIHHSPTPYAHNLRSCFRYGGGDYVRHHILGQHDEASLASKYEQVLKTYNPFEALVMVTNDISYECGYLIGSIKSNIAKTSKLGLLASSHP